MKSQSLTAWLCTPSMTTDKYIKILLLTHQSDRSWWHWTSYLATEMGRNNPAITHHLCSWSTCTPEAQSKQILFFQFHHYSGAELLEGDFSTNCGETFRIVLHKKAWSPKQGKGFQWMQRGASILWIPDESMGSVLTDSNYFGEFEATR